MSALTEQCKRCATVLLLASLVACGGDESASTKTNPQGSTRTESGERIGSSPAEDSSGTSAAASQPRFDPRNLSQDAAFDSARQGEPFRSEREAVAAFEDAYRDVDLDRMQEMWERMNAVQRFAAYQAGKALSEDAAMGDYQRMLPAEYLLDAENSWELQAAAEREARGEGPAPAPAVVEMPAPTLETVPASERGILRGVVVVEGSGEPVAGVQLVASPTGLAALQLLLGQGEELSAVTADDGTFEIAGVPAGEVSLVGQKLPHYPLISHRATAVAQEIVEVRVELPPARTLRLELPVVIAGVVRDELSGEPVAGVHVSAGRHGGAKSDARGRYLIGEADLGEIELATEHADYHPSSSLLVAERRGRIDHDLSIQPITTGILEGIVVDSASGLPLPGATVALLGTEISTDAEGRFRIEEVEAGEITLTGHSPRYRAAVASVALARRTTTTARLELDPITEGRVFGVVTNAATGRPLARARVEIGPHEVETDADGRFELAEVPAGETGVTARRAVFEPAGMTIEVVAAEAVEVALALEPITYGTVVVRVEDAATGSPLADSEIRLRGSLTARTDAAGRVRFERVAAGPGVLAATLHAYEDGTGRFDLAPAAEVEATLRLEPVTVGVVEGRVVVAGSGRPVAGAEITIADRRLTADGQGRFRFEDIAAGAASVAASKAVFEPASRTVDVVAAATATVELELDPITYGTLTGVVVEAGSGRPVPDARVTARGSSASTDARGRFVLERVAAGALQLSASRPVYEPATEALTLDPAATVERRLVLEPIVYGRLTGQVVDADSGRPLAGADVNVGGQSLTTGADGRFAVARIDAGELTISARKSAYQPGGTSVTLEPAGAVDARLELEPIRVGTVGGVVRDARTGEPIAGARVAVGGQEVETDAQGRFQLAGVNAGGVGVGVRHADYGDGAVSAELSGGGTLDLEVRLDLRREDVTQLESALAAKGMIDLYGIHFDSGDDQFKPSSLSTLEAVLQVIRRSPGKTFRIAGHTDSDGSDAYNQDLSERRAGTVILWLVDRGIDSERLQPAGYGESRPAAPNDTPSGKALNRRVELGYGR